MGPHREADRPPLRPNTDSMLQYSSAPSQWQRGAGGVIVLFVAACTASYLPIHHIGDTTSYPSSSQSLRPEPFGALSPTLKHGGDYVRSARPNMLL
mmetsp:Transcript_29454/g.50144  ORF Transcript_29454/g.50144 Transcript_29454/m.50144 type:complete len:96 (-) Transcript_29454:28-315(-)